MILKPSEQVPISANRIAELLKEAGLPDGVFNVVNGDKESSKQFAIIRKLRRFLCGIYQWLELSIAEKPNLKDVLHWAVLKII